MKSISTEEQRIEALELGYLSPFIIERFDVINKKGKFGDYHYGYKISLSTKEGGKFFLEVPRNSELYAVLHGSIMKNGIKTFSSSKSENGEQIFHQVLE
ncbi:MAG: hypothetical protein ACYCO0_05305 [Candidatus Micrarchaeaceae archaeon]